MITSNTAKCPVCRAILGTLVKGQVCFFACQECHWLFTWKADGKLGKPTNLNEKKSNICDCGSCQVRDERDKVKRRDFFTGL